MTDKALTDAINMHVTKQAAHLAEWDTTHIEGLLPETEARLAWRICKQRALVGRALNGPPEEMIRHMAALERGLDLVIERLRKD